MSTSSAVQNHEPTEETKREEGSWKDFFYNSRTGELLGRTASSWGLILLFYLIFYGFLAGMFCLTIWVMLQTLDENVPRHQDRVADPGNHPIIHKKMFKWQSADCFTASWQYVKPLVNRNSLKCVSEYNDSMQERNDLCLVGEYTDQDQGSIKKVCQFKRSILRQCSGLPDTSFGYAEGKPCIIVKMNRVRNLSISKQKQDSPLQMQYFPPEGRLDKMFFPYYGKKLQPDYVQPLVAVKLLLTKDDYNIEQTVECKVEGSHLRNNDERDKYMGRVTFRVKVLQ
uniref:Sodium/potassium-transporting ATPase subunit beta n=1 Tax=Oryzias sinensis TaxID=183150 RepID=A0A8C7Z260_9TELE